MPYEQSVNLPEKLIQRFQGRLMTEQEAAGFLHLSVTYLRADRWRGNTIPYVKIGRCIRYRQTDLITAIEQMTVAPESSKSAHSNCK
jgi:hypothetical protein